MLLEIVSGIPLWMSLKTLVRRKGCDMIKYGLFAVKGRLFDKIIKKQIEVVQNLEHYLVEEVRLFDNLELLGDCVGTGPQTSVEKDAIDRPEPEN